MKIRAVILCLALILAAPYFAQLAAREKSDVLVMKNGDRITCEVKSLSSGVLYAKIDYVDGTISIDWGKVARIESNQQFLVKTEAGIVYTGTLSTLPAADGKPVQIEVAGNLDKKTVLDRKHIVGMGETSESFWQRFNGNVDFGTLYSKGNQTAQYSLGSLVNYPRERWAAQATYNSSLSSNTGADTSTRNQINLLATRLLRWDNWYYAGFASFLESSEQGIQLQNSIGGGIGRFLKNTNNATITLLGGVAWQSTNYQPDLVPIERQNIAAAVVAGQVNLFKFKKTNLNLIASVLPALNEPGRVFFSTNATYYIKIFPNLSWNFSFYGDWDNRPPATFSGSNYGTSSGLSWTFGSK